MIEICLKNLTVFQIRLHKHLELYIYEYFLINM